MIASELEKAKIWVDNWRQTGLVLERLRIEEHSTANLNEILVSLSDVTRSSLLAHPPEPTSGIIEMQRLFGKIRK
ncbi:hypothetical protein BH10ACI2_BH10ACI2_26050 [soil metagenome]